VPTFLRSVANRTSGEFPGAEEVIGMTLAVGYLLIVGSMLWLVCKR